MLVKLLLDMDINILKGTYFVYCSDKNLIKYCSLPNKELELALLVHEIGHIKYSTNNFELILKGSIQEMKQQKELFLILEDLRVDTLLLEEFKGFKNYYQEIAGSLYEFSEEALSSKFNNILLNLFRIFCGHAYQGAYQDIFKTIYPLFVKAIRATDTEKCFKISQKMYPYLISN